jgi:hypothetical protein
MATQKVRPDPGALERQETRQRRRSVGKRVGAFAVAAAVVLIALAFVWALRPAERDAPADGGATEKINTAPAADETAAALTAARGFFDGFAAFDAERTMNHVADNADLSGVIDGQVAPDEAGLAQMLAWLEAWGYRQSITSCEAAPPTQTVGGEGTDIAVTCTFAFTMMPELERGPFPGSTFDFVTHDGEIVTATLEWNTAEFSPAIWEPFSRWVASDHPKDFDEMYIEGGTNVHLSDASILLWERNAKAYVEAVQSGNAE